MTASNPAAADGALRITQTASPPGLAIAGDIDESSYEELVSALAATSDWPGDEVHVNMSAVTYCDLAGLRAIIGVTMGRNGGRLGASSDRRDRSASSQPASGQPASGQPASGQPAPGQAAPGQPASGQAAPGQPASGQPASDQPASGQPTSGLPGGRGGRQVTLHAIPDELRAVLRILGWDSVPGLVLAEGAGDAKARAGGGMDGPMGGGASR